jgi:DNA adenine methylase
MKYQGSKNRIAKYILPIILEDADEHDVYWEPFVGGGNMIDKVEFNGLKVGSDIDELAIDALVTIKSFIDKIPKNNMEFTEKDYHIVKKFNHNISGYAAYALSYGGKKWGGWCRDKEGKRDYVAEAYKNAIKQSKKIQDVKFTCCCYLDLNFDNATIYCDPPYKNTTKYSVNFDYEVFYDWCRKQKEKGNKVFVSEYNMPIDFTCLWEKEIVSSLTKDTGSKKGIERLYTI